jgi:hypothetical protein
MKGRKLSHISLLLGLTIGLFAVWAGVTPVAGDSSVVVGGYAAFYDTWFPGSDYPYGASTSTDCYVASGVTYRSCTEYGRATCTGGYIYVANCASTGYYWHSLSGHPCSGPTYCVELWNASTSE